MNTKEMLEQFKELTEKMYQTAYAKNSDYTGKDGENPFSNFEAVEVDKITTTERGFLTRMRDKWQRIISFVNNGNYLVKTESVEDTLLDLANYCILLILFMRSKRKSDKKHPLEVN